MVTACGGMAALFISVRDRPAGVLGAADVREMTAVLDFSWFPGSVRSGTCRRFGAFSPARTAYLAGDPWWLNSILFS